MGIVNATPDSFSDRQGPKDLDELRVSPRRSRRRRRDRGRGGRVRAHRHRGRLRRGGDRARAAAGGATGGGGMTVSVDTWRAPVARAVLEAGAAMINDVSGLSDERLAVECAEAGAALVITHTRARPKEKVFPHYEDVVADVVELLRSASGWRARTAWPGSRSCSTRDRPGQDARRVGGAAARLDRLAALGRPLLVAVSRKDFIGVLTERPPAARTRARCRRGRGAPPRRADPAGARRGGRATTCACTRRSRASGRWRRECVSRAEWEHA